MMTVINQSSWMRACLRSVLGSTVLAAFLAGGQAAAAYPERPIKLVSPWAPGGANDIFSRALAQKLAVSLGQPVVVENRPGAAGTIGSDVVAKAPADGYTLVMGSSPTHSIAPSLYPSLPYAPLRDFVPITLAAVVPNILVVHPSLPIQSVSQLIDYAKANPGKLNFSSTGNGSSQHLFGEYFKYLAGIDMTHVPYKGTAPALNDLIAGRVQLAFENPPALLPHIRAGNLRPLAVAAAQRSALLPDVPTVVEAGLKGYDVSVWFGIFAPAGTPKAVVDKLHHAIDQALAQPDLRAQLQGLGADVVSAGPEAFSDYLSKEIPKWAGIIKEANVTLN